MKSDQFWTAVSKALTTLTVMLIVTVVLASGAAAASQYKVLHTFTWASTLYGGLTFDAAGNLYGTTEGGGAYGYGVVFKLTHDPDGSWTESTLFSFTGGSDGGNPWDVPTFDAAGNLYGTTTSGGLGYGTVFKLTPNPDAKWTESVVYRFTGGDDGETPMAGLILDGAGNLYGTTYTGGNYGAGTVFKLTPNLGGSWTQTVLHHFTGSDGSNIVAGVISDATGNLYGAATRGGADGSGVVFKLKPNPDGSWTQSVLHTFAGGSDGTYPDHGSLVLDGHGNLYGATADGGTGSCSFVGLPGCGAIFELTPNPDGTWTEHMLHRFSGGADGATPEPTLIFDASGNLYGTTLHGGCGGYGVVFRLTPTSSGWKETVLHDFLGVGKYPYAGVIMDAVGNLYGTASSGTNNYGLVFEITQSTVDQSWTPSPNLGADINECCAFIGQTYTAGITGVLEGVSVDVGDSTSKFPLHVAIRTVAGGLPTTTVLGEVTLGSNSSGLSQVIVFPQVIPQTAGVQYAIVVDYPGAPPEGAGQMQGVWYGAGGYGGGMLVASFDYGKTFALTYPNYDVDFITFVSPTN